MSSREIALVDLGAEAGSADQSGDHRHRQGEHDHLVDAGHHGRQRQRQLGPAQDLARGRAEGVPGLHDLGSTCRMPSSVSRTPGGSAKITVATRPGETPMLKSVTIGTSQTKAGIVCMRSMHRADHRC